MANMDSSQPNRHSSVQPHRLDQHALACRCRNLLADSRGLPRVRDRPDAFGGNQRFQTRHGLLEHRVLADDVQKLFWRARPAARPEPRSAPPGENHCVRCQFFHCPALPPLVEDRLRNFVFRTTSTTKVGTQRCQIGNICSQELCGFLLTQCKWP